MYENEIYSDSDVGNQTSGVFSGAQNPMTQTEKNTNEAAQETTNNYATYETGSNNVFTGSYEQTDFKQSNSGSDKDKKKKKSGKGGFFRKALVSVSLGLLFGAFAGAGFYAVQWGLGLTEQADADDAVVKNQAEFKDGVKEESGIKLANTNNITVVQSDISDVVEEVMPAMVSIVNNYTETGSFFGQTYTQEQASSGSGIIVAENEEELLIVSNYHVIADTTTLEVTFIDGNTAEAKIKGTDSDMDLAVIAVPLKDIGEETKDAISIATLGDSDALKLGEPVIAIGNALGYGQSVTNGIVSALNREITMSDGSKGTFIQTNAAINPGNSGGALLNINGEVIGISSNKIGGDIIEGMGYAIPISSANPIIADLMEHHTRDKVAEDEVGYMGISLQVVTEQSSQWYNMPIGVFIRGVEEGSAAEKAGLMAGDIIVEFDGEKITSDTDLQNTLQYYAAGDSAKVTVMRPERGEYVEYEFDITLGKREK